MRPEAHLAISTALFLALGLAFESWSLSVGAFLSGVFVDLDHVPEYLIQYGWRPDPRHFLRVFLTADKEFRKAYFFLHGWEWLALGAAVAWMSGWNGWVTGLWIGWAVHLACDQAFNHVGAWGYFIFWRAAHRFDYPRMFPQHFKNKE